MFVLQQYEKHISSFLSCTEKTLKNISEYSRKDNTLDTYATLFIAVHMFQINRSLDTTNEKTINSLSYAKYFSEKSHHCRKNK